MRVQILPSCVDRPEAHQFLSSYILNDDVAVDAGALGTTGLDRQRNVRHVLITHSHVDHVATLPMFVENAFSSGQQPVVVHGHPETLDCLRRDVFNDRIWPDYFRIADIEGENVVEFHPLEAEKTVELAGLRVTPVPVDHIVPTFGYVVEDGSAAVVFGGDSGPTERIWQVARSTRNLRAAFIETSFPNRMIEFAELTKHLTPRMLAAEMDKLGDGVQVVVIHIKVAYHEEVIAELKALGHPRLQIGLCGVTYEF